MNSFVRRHPIVRWAAPVAVVGAVAVTQVLGSAAQAAPALPQRSAQQLVAAALKADVPGLSGTVRSSADLGLPSLPDSMSTNTVSGIPLQWLSGEHTAKVWMSRTGGARIALLGRASETDLIANRTDVWLWNSSDRSLKHQAIPASMQGAPAAHMSKDCWARTDAPDASSYTPQGIAKEALATIRSSSATVSSDENVWVAGRKAYELVITPTQSATKIGSVRLAVDAKTSVPTRVQIFARGASSPALSLGFTSVSFKAPAAGNFTFGAPKGVTATPFTSGSPTRAPRSGASATHPGTAGLAPTVVGKDWASVLVANLPPMKGDGSAKGGANSMSSMLRLLPEVSGGWGSGHLLDTSLFSAVVTDAGRIAIGAVQPTTLYAALAGH